MGLQPPLATSGDVHPTCVWECVNTPERSAYHAWGSHEWIQYSASIARQKPDAMTGLRVTLWKEGMENISPEVTLPGFKSQLSHSGTQGHWVNHLTSLASEFPAVKWKVKINVLLSRGRCKD